MDLDFCAKVQPFNLSFFADAGRQPVTEWVEEEVEVETTEYSGLTRYPVM